MTYAVRHEMMKSKWIVAILWVVGVLPVEAGDALQGLPELPQKRVSMTILSDMPATNLLQFVAHRNGIRLDLADGIKTNTVSFKFRFDNADTRHVISWALHFLNAAAILTNGTLHVVPRSGQEPTPVVRDDSSQAQSVPLLDLLGRPFDQDRAVTFPAHQVLEWVLHRAGIHNDVFAPECSRAMQDVTVSAGSRQFSDVLTDVCDQSGLKWSVRWEAVFIERKDSIGDAQPEN